MIISRTPFRVSFFGGGTDYPTWYQENGGAVLSTTIDKYCYITTHYLPPFFEYKHRVVWSKIEQINDIGDIQHPAVKAALQYLAIDKGVAIHHEGDLPARTGLGSSSAFSVGLLHALYALTGQMVGKGRLAKEAIYLEQTLLKENVGVQDQIQVAHGGLNYTRIHHDGQFDVQPVILKAEREKELERNLVLYFTGISRTASDIAAQKIQSIPNKKAELKEMRAMVDEGFKILIDGSAIDDFGKLLHESWLIKRSLASSVSTECVDDLYQKARAAGATGGKLLGAGGGGFLLLFVSPEKRAEVRNALKGYLEVTFKFEKSGAQIIFCDNEVASNV